MQDNQVVGLAGPLSGERSAHASLLHEATAYFTEQNITYLLEDDKAEPEMALRVAKYFITNKVKAVIGHFNSACAAAVIPLYRQHNIPLILPASSQTDLTNGDGNTFRLCATDRQQVALMLAQLNMPSATIEIAIDESSYAQRLLKALPTAPWRIVTVTDTPADTTQGRLVFATCAQAIRAVSVLKNWPGLAIYSDDAHVEDFFQCSKQLTKTQIWVIGAPEGYATLMRHACGLITAAFRSHCISISTWLQQFGGFSVNGDALQANWQIFNFTDIVSFKEAAYNSSDLTMKLPFLNKQ